MVQRWKGLQDCISENVNTIQLLKEVTSIVLEYVILANIIAVKNHYIVQKYFNQKQILKDI